MEEMIIDDNEGNNYDVKKEETTAKVSTKPLPHGETCKQRNDADRTDTSQITDLVGNEVDISMKLAKTKDNYSKDNVLSSKGYVPDCITCDASKSVAMFCMTCEESFCESCASVHRSQKATRNHVLNEYTSLQETIFLCDTCGFVQSQSPAKASCKDCEELYCDTCASVHKTQKASRTHTISNHVGLSEKHMCEPCQYNGQNDKKAVCLCVDCDEVQCTDCKSVHVKQKVTRNHTVILSAACADTFCRLCWTSGKENLPDTYCKVCYLKLCLPCADTHRQDPSKSEHKLLDINRRPQATTKSVARETSSKQSNDLKKATLQGNEKEAPFQRKDKTRTIKDATKPGKPCVAGQVHVDTVSLVWEPAVHPFANHNYQLRYKETDGISKWTFYPELTTRSSIIVNNLKSDTQYVFQVRMVNDEIEGPYSEISENITTIQSAAHLVMDFMYDAERPDVNITVKKLPLQGNIKTRNQQAKTRKLVVGNAYKTHTRERTIMLVGSTGTGKSTLVDGMVNYILGVNWNDPYRLTLVDLEEDEKTRGTDQAVSQTQWITCYTLNPLKGSRLDFTLNIIDTPGFGDTGGIDRDKEIMEQIRTLFSRDDETGILFIDAVCFLIKAPDARLTPTQLYIFNAIMSLFGQDIKDNFCMLVTFADGKRPPVLSALKAANLPHEQFFQFNNSGLFAENTGDNVSSISPMFWDMGCKSFQLFFDKLTQMETKSLRQTRDVLAQREVIQITLDNLLPKLDAGLSKVEEMRIEIRILEDYKTQIEENSDFTYTVSETEQRQLDLPTGQHVTNCLNCHITCHTNCYIPNDEDKRKCWAMGVNGYCRQCGCFWNIHRNTPYIFEYVTVEKQKTYTEKLKKYRRAEGETMTRKNVVERMYDELYDLEDDILDLVEKINECNNILRSIALRPDPLSVVEHIDLLIESERLEKRPGFQARIASLRQCRKKATVCDDVDRFRKSFTDTTKIITAQVNLPPKPKMRQRRGCFDFFKPVANFFQR